MTFVLCYFNGEQRNCQESRVPDLSPARQLDLRFRRSSVSCDAVVNLLCALQRKPEPPYGGITLGTNKRPHGAFPICRAVVLHFRLAGGIGPVRSLPLDAKTVLYQAALSFFQASAIAGTIVLIVHIDKAITLCHFAGGSRHKVDAAPHGIAHQVDAIFFHGGFHRLDMAAQVVDAAAVVDGAMPNTLISLKVSQYFTLPV